ncbi:hypothetical protein JHK82_030246 [Glycine max]|uniref:Uncharacterized protein n=2 Tax=Glycine subgen. Soja TaxID=1462606 RepID=A0A0R0HM42_SOYBN|nr:hypothetical protein JHK87_030141 [Glycine soja]KAG5123509.1 hypothetical protein JHK82_030246 [Glycine max]KAG5144933.1 hypothetical protein JHK84_030476 [Glycine max]KAH1157891.1 hypothetical protein GYH30_030228 [Glycine max]KRH28632.1 hypothetical protein GLYMA_11G065400v4 [Glycine max]
MSAAFHTHSLVLHVCGFTETDFLVFRILPFPMVVWLLLIPYTGHAATYSPIFLQDGNDCILTMRERNRAELGRYYLFL